VPVQLFYGKPEPVWVINQRRRGLGTEPYYDSSSSGGYGSRPAEFGPYSRGNLLPVSCRNSSKLCFCAKSVTSGVIRSLFLSTQTSLLIQMYSEDMDMVYSTLT
jgi:hypothetical protein